MRPGQAGWAGQGAGEQQDGPADGLWDPEANLFLRICDPWTWGTASCEHVRGQRPASGPGLGRSHRREAAVCRSASCEAALPLQPCYRNTWTTTT